MQHADGAQGDRLTIDGVESVLSQLRGSRQAVEVTAVINAFAVPKISYDPVGRKLFEDTSKRSIFAAANVREHATYTCMAVQRHANVYAHCIPCVATDGGAASVLRHALRTWA